MEIKDKKDLTKEDKKILKSKYSPAGTIDYYKFRFQAGLVKGCVHKRNCIYLRMGEFIHNLTADEAQAVITCLSRALWVHQVNKGRKGYFNIKWLSHQDLMKTVEGKMR